ncbi:MAG: AAA family ATPase [Bacteroidota bacterium]|jgi:predicted ATP-dependent endonuclease of OLD family|nr:AAA family ATPase [Bacteroidales bacterium]MDI9592278.1 AAA family ATPase [Bacteroidota bacterium]
MKIKKVEIRDYKVFYGLNEFNVEGKNLFIYGENRSGKSTIYRALYTLLESAFKKNEFEVEKYFSQSLTTHLP